MSNLNFLYNTTKKQIKCELNDILKNNKSCVSWLFFYHWWSAQTSGSSVFFCWKITILNTFLLIYSFEGRKKQNNSEIKKMCFFKSQILPCSCKQNGLGPNLSCLGGKQKHWIYSQSHFCMRYACHFFSPPYKRANLYTATNIISRLYHDKHHSFNEKTMNKNIPVPWVGRCVWLVFVRLTLCPMKKHSVWVCVCVCACF